MFSINLQPVVEARVNRMLQDPKMLQAQDAILDNVIVESLTETAKTVDTFSAKLLQLKATPDSEIKNKALIDFYERALSALSSKR